MSKKKNDFQDENDFELIEEQPEVVVVPKDLHKEKEREKDLHKEKEKERENEREKENPPSEVTSGKKSEKCDCKSCEGALDKAEEYKKLLQLSQADFDNYRKRSFTMLQNARAEGEINVLSKFLPALDSFDKAKVMITDANILKGVEMIEKQIKDNLLGLGVTEIDPINKPFNPDLHNAISTSQNSSLGDDIVAQVFQKGYMYNDKVIRYAQVIINKKGEN